MADGISIPGQPLNQVFYRSGDASGVVKGQGSQFICKRGNISCRITSLRVIDNRAIIGGVITSAPTGTNVVMGTEVCRVVVDNGNGKGVDRISFTYSGDTELDSCKNRWPLPDADLSASSFDDPFNDFYRDIRISGVT